MTEDVVQPNVIVMHFSFCEEKKHKWIETQIIM